MFKLSEGVFTASQESFFFAPAGEKILYAAFGIGEFFTGETAIAAGDFRSGGNALNDVFMGRGVTEKSFKIPVLDVVQHKGAVTEAVFTQTAVEIDGQIPSGTCGIKFPGM